MYLEKDNHPCARTVCSHYELDAREYMCEPGRPKPFALHGAVDGFVCDTALAKKMAFIGKFGSSCDVPFNKAEFFKKHRQWAKFAPYIKDRPVEPWTEFTITSLKDLKGKDSKSKFRLTKRNKSKHNTTVKNKI